jgi:hypothetical protein
MKLDVRLNKYQVPALLSALDVLWGGEVKVRLDGSLAEIAGDLAALGHLPGMNQPRPNDGHPSSWKLLVDAKSCCLEWVPAGMTIQRGVTLRFSKTPSLETACVVQIDLPDSSPPGTYQGFLNRLFGVEINKVDHVEFKQRQSVTPLGTNPI